MFEYVSFPKTDGRHLILSRVRRGRVRVFSISPNRIAYWQAGEPFGKNRKAMKRWLREVKASEYFDERDAWLCGCGNFITDGVHCSSCGGEPPWGCPCDFREEDRGRAEYYEAHDGYYDDDDDFENDDDDDDDGQWWEEDDDDDEY